MSAATLELSVNFIKWDVQEFDGMFSMKSSCYSRSWFRGFTGLIRVAFSCDIRATPLHRGRLGACKIKGLCT